MPATLDPVNAIADAAPGFVWRLQDDAGNATHLPVDDDPLVIGPIETRFGQTDAREGGR